MKYLRIFLIVLLAVSSVSFYTNGNIEFADCPNPAVMIVNYEPCDTVQGQITSLAWSGVGGFNWYIDNNYLGFTSSSQWTYDYFLDINPLNLGNGTHTFSVQGADSSHNDCSNTNRLNVNFTISGC